MKTKISMLSIIIFAGAMACKKSGSPYTPECPATVPKFSTEVSAIIAADCTTSGCHNSGSKKGPGALTTYDQVKGASSSIRSEVVSGSMPKDHTMTDARRNSIVCWIDAGANND